MYPVFEVTSKEMQESRRYLQNVGNAIPEKVEKMQETEENHEAIEVPVARRRETVAAENLDVHFDRRFAQVGA